MKIIKEKVVLTKFELEDVYGEEYIIYLNSILALSHTVHTDTNTNDTYTITFITENSMPPTERVDVSEEDWCKIKEIVEENIHLNVTEHKYSDSVTYEFYEE